MKNIFTKEFMKNNSGCYSSDKLDACSFMSNEEITLESILLSEIRLTDKYWFVCYILCDEEQNRKIALNVALIVLPLFEIKYPEDKRPREAVEIAKLYMSGEDYSEESLIDKRDGAYSAFAQTRNDYSSRAAYAAAKAAQAASKRLTLSGVADTAYTGVDAAYSACLCYGDYTANYIHDKTEPNEFSNRLLDYLIDFCK